MSQPRVEVPRNAGAHRPRNTVQFPQPDSGTEAPNLNLFEQLLNERFQAEMSPALFGAEDRELRRLITEVSSFHLSEDSGANELRQYRSLLLRIGSYLAAQSQIRSELRCLALTDDLTGLYNRRGFLILGMQLLKLARRGGQSALLLFADVDGLKAVNDRHGHAMGDAFLLRCAAALKETFRESDIIARLGGDEFAVLVLEAHGENTETVLDRLEKAIRNSNDVNSSCHLSLSVGASRFGPENEVSLGYLLADADRDMYERKYARFPNRMGAHSVLGDD